MRPVIRTAARPLPRLSEGSPGFAALLSALLPGLGQVYQERWRRGLVMFLVPVVAAAILAGLLIAGGPPASAILRSAALFAVLIVGGLFAYHVTVIAEAFAGRLRGTRVRARHAVDYGLLLAIVLGLSVTYLAIYRHSTLWASVLATTFEPVAGRTLGAGTTLGGTAAPGWSGRERLNVLVLGIDTRDDDPVTQNTDTILVLSVDPEAKNAAMLSIPRDTLVDIPGIGKDKVNSAYVHATDPKRNGAELARRTVERFLGIPIHSYAVIDFAAFRQTVDSVGGVVIDIKRPLRDEEYPTSGYGVRRIELRAGPQLLDGEEALEYARSRHDSNDFSRARRQQTVLLALRARLAQGGLFRLPGVLDRVGPLVRTSFDPGNVLPLARTVLGIDGKEIRSEVLLPCGGDEPHCELNEENAADGYYLIPDLAKVRALVSEVFPGAKPASVR
jgi:LCP family protein required for cell wall assembly